MDTEKIKATVDEKLPDLLSVIMSKQVSFAIEHGGKFWQGFSTKEAPPSDGMIAKSDVGIKSPNDSEPWPSEIISDDMPMSVRVDVYDGPLGKGYTVTSSVSISSEIWERVDHVGPERWRGRDWYALKSDFKAIDAPTEESKLTNESELETTPSFMSKVQGFFVPKRQLLAKVVEFPVPAETIDQTRLDRFKQHISKLYQNVRQVTGMGVGYSIDKFTRGKQYIREGVNYSVDKVKDTWEWLNA